MVKITNGKNVFEVTRGAFDSIYSRQGYRLVDEKKTTTRGNTNGKTGDEKFLEEIVEKPVSKWTKDEIKRFASLNGIDITGTKNADEAKEIIKEYLDNNSEEE